MNSKNLIEKLYHQYRNMLIDFIDGQIGDRNVAVDLTHDVFLRLLSYNKPFFVKSLKNLSFSIALNLTRDYWRHHIRQREVYAYIDMCMEMESNQTWEEIVVNDLKWHEQKCLDKMPEKRRKIYERRRFYDESAKDIADVFSLSPRTVENQLRLGMRDVRQYFRVNL